MELKSRQMEKQRSGNGRGDPDTLRVLQRVSLKSIKL